MDSTETVEYLGISKQRLSDMNRQGKLVAIKKGIYLKQDVYKRKKFRKNSEKNIIKDKNKNQ